VDIDELKNRRQFFIGVSRNAVLGLLVAVGAIITVKRHRLLRDGKCINEGLCRCCAVFEYCGLPRALVMKELVAGHKDGRKTQ